MISFPIYVNDKLITRKRVFKNYFFGACIRISQNELDLWEMAELLDFKLPEEWDRIEWWHIPNEEIRFYKKGL